MILRSEYFLFNFNLKYVNFVYFCKLSLLSNSNQVYVKHVMTNGNTHIFITLKVLTHMSFITDFVFISFVSLLFFTKNISNSTIVPFTFWAVQSIHSQFFVILDQHHGLDYFTHGFVEPVPLLTVEDTYLSVKRKKWVNFYLKLLKNESKGEIHVWPDGPDRHFQVIQKYIFSKPIFSEF